MTEQIFTFWDGKLPEYLKLCMETWKFPYILLTYDNVLDYAYIPIDKLQRFSLPQIADYIRVHILRDHGGYWLDTDTIMLGPDLPAAAILGNAAARTNTIGFLHTEQYSDIFTKWAAYQDSVLEQNLPADHWAIMGNAFTDEYLKDHNDIVIDDISNRWVETYMIDAAISRWDKYQKFYFESQYSLKDLRNTDMIMLHNSWTPAWYKQLSRSEILSNNCTMSNILKEAIK